MEPGDWILLSLAGAAAIPFILANIVILRFRHRSYFKAHGGVALILLGSTAGLLWIASDFVTNGHISKRQDLLAECVLWAFWIKLSLGLCLWLICIILRLRRMNFLIDNPRQNSRWSSSYFILIPLLMLPNILVSAAASIFSHAKVDHGQCCKFKPGWSLTRYFAIPPVYFLGVVIFLLRLRKKQGDLLVRREFIHTCDFCVMTFFVYVLSGVTYLTKGNQHVTGRCFLTFCVCCLVFMHFWVRMAWPVYLCLLRPESEMNHYEEELRCSGASIFNAFRAASGRLGIYGSSSEGAILHALHEAVEQITEFKDRIAELRSEKSRLQAEIDSEQT